MRLVARDIRMRLAARSSRFAARNLRLEAHVIDGFPMTVGFSEFHGNFLLRDSTFFIQPITQCCAINCTLLCNLLFSC